MAKKIIYYVYQNYKIEKIVFDDEYIFGKEDGNPTPYLFKDKIGRPKFMFLLGKTYKECKEKAIAHLNTCIQHNNEKIILLQAENKHTREVIRDL